MIHYTCGCGARYTLSDDLAGRRIRCPKCGAKGRTPLVISEPSRLKVPSEEELERIDLEEFLDAPE